VTDPAASAALTDPAVPALHHRRIVFQGMGALGAALALAGCAGGGDASADAEAPESGTELTTVSEVPVGGGIVLRDASVVVTQPTEGEFLAFSGVCTHQGAALARVEDGQIECDLHGSRFDAASGEVTEGPATAALPEVQITRDGDRILSA